MSFWVYILRCADGSYYTGHTDNLERRFAQHTSGAIPSCYTHQRRPVELAFSQEFSTREDALASERQIKGWSRKKKEAMMRGDWIEVSRLAQSPTVRAEPVEARSSFDCSTSSQLRTNEETVRAEPVEAHSEARSSFDKLRTNEETVRAEPVEAHSPTVRAEPVEAHSPTVRAEPVEAQFSSGEAPPFDCSTSSQLRANGR